MEHTKAYQEYKKNGNTKFVRYSEGAEMYHMSGRCEIFSVNSDLL